MKRVGLLESSFAAADESAVHGARDILTRRKGSVAAVFPDRRIAVSRK